MELRKMKMLLRVNLWIIQFPLLVFCIAVIAFLFFNSILVCIITSGLSFLLIKPLKKMHHERLAKEQESEFMVFIYSLSSMLSIGKSFESAFRQSLEELEKEGNDYLITKELKKVCLCFEMNMSVAEGLAIFAERYPIESIRNFSNIIEVAINRGGSIEMIIEATVSMIREKNDVEKELEVLITQKRYELFMLLSFVPMMIFYMRCVSQSFSLAMYNTLFGRVVMFISFGIFLLSGYIGKKIVDIKV